MSTRTWLWIFGTFLFVLGILGFTPEATRADVLLGLFQTEALLNAIHLIVGALALVLAWKAPPYTQLFFQVFGTIFALMAVVGLLEGDSVLGLVAVNLSDNILHLVLAAAALWIGFGVKGESAPPMVSAI